MELINLSCGRPRRILTKTSDIIGFVKLPLCITRGLAAKDLISSSMASTAHLLPDLFNVGCRVNHGGSPHALTRHMQIPVHVWLNTKRVWQGVLGL
jgi:hypothetical protein